MSQPRVRGCGRASWTGLLQVSLVAVPVKAYPAVSTTDAVHFHQLHAGCGERIRQDKRCPRHGPVDGAEIVKGYQYAPDQYVVVDEAELDRLRPPRDKALVLEQFADAGQLDPALFSGRTLYLFPHGLPAHRAYIVLVAAMQARGCCAIGRVTLSGHRRVAVVRPAGRLLVMHVLHDPAQLRSAQPLEAELPATEPSAQELALAAALIDAASGAVDWSQYRDDTAEKLAQLVEAKLAGREPAAPEEEPLPVLQLLEALQQSVAQTAGPTAPRPASLAKSRTRRQRRTA
jgi:DNA end-binding protein Ku